MNRTRRRPRVGLVLPLLLALATACGGSGADGAGRDAPPQTPTGRTEPSEATRAASDTVAESVPIAPTLESTVDSIIESTAVEAAPTTDTVPAATDTAAVAVDALDDLDEDGTFDARCGLADLGAGLIIETLCNEALIPVPEVGVTPTPQSVLLVPSPSRWDDLVDVDATVRVATTADGKRVAIYVLGSDTLFDSGQATLRPTAEPPLAAIVASIAARFPGSTVTVRGAADSVGSPAANDDLSRRRAEAVGGRLGMLGIDPARIVIIGLGSSVPAALETNPDGSVSEIGRQLNRRVEIVVVAP